MLDLLVLQANQAQNSDYQRSLRGSVGTVMAMLFVRPAQRALESMRCLMLLQKTPRSPYLDGLANSLSALSKVRFDFSVKFSQILKGSACSVGTSGSKPQELRGLLAGLSVRVSVCLRLSLCSGSLHLQGLSDSVFCSAGKMLHVIHSTSVCASKILCCCGQTREVWSVLESKTFGEQMNQCRASVVDHHDVWSQRLRETERERETQHV